MFQSPDERGRVLRPPIISATSLTLRKVFNPLTSGAGTATFAAALAMDSDPRGFNPLTSGAGYCDNGSSVRSISQATPGFNPLTSGAGTATRPRP